MILAVAKPKFFAKSEPPKKPRRTSVKPSDVKRAIQHAQNLCFNFEDTPECRIAWGVVDELSSELARQNDQTREDELEQREYDL